MAVRSTYQNLFQRPGSLAPESISCSSPGMVFFNRLPEPGPHHVGVNLRGRNISVAQHHLNAAQIRPAFQQMCGKTVTQYVGRKPVKNAGFAAMAGKKLPERLACKATATAGNKKITAGAALEQQSPAVAHIF